MYKKPQRILWLLNHKTLMDAEVSMLVSLGYEVYVPKLYINDESNQSAKISFEFDCSLSLPADLLEKLNAFNFYQETFTPEISAILNCYFSVAFVAFFPAMFEELLRVFEGHILLRVFGLAGDANYSSLMDCYLSDAARLNLYQKKKKFWFAQGYETLNAIENDFIKQRTVTLPLGLPKDIIIKLKDSYKGVHSTLLFVCPRINSSPEYYGQIYKEFKKNLGGFNHVIAGKQPVPVDDSAVLGALDDAEYFDLFVNCKVIFYHSTEARHIHYHPVEAIICGMPVIYMAGSLFASLITDDSGRLGECVNYDDAKEKINRILMGDEVFVNSIVKGQKSALQIFTASFCQSMWEKNFSEKVLNSKIFLEHAPEIKTAVKKIAVFLPVGYKGGSLRGAQLIAKMLKQGSAENGEAVDVVFSCLKNTYDIESDFSVLLNLNIEVRETIWKEKIFCGKKYIIPDDGIAQFNDCDVWFIISDRLLAPIFPEKITILLIYDYIQRYIPELFKALKAFPVIDVARSADHVVATTKASVEDIQQYAGIAQDKISLLPIWFDIPPALEQVKELNLKASLYQELPDEYFVWVTNASVHKNHIRALKAIVQYYEKGGNLSVVMMGVDLNTFKYNDTLEQGYQAACKSFIDQHPILNEKLVILDFLDELSFYKVMNGARFNFHPALIDNGTFSVLEAAYLNIPSVSSNYPQMLEMNIQFGLDLLLFDPFSVAQMTDALLRMTTEYRLYKERLPIKNDLVKHSGQVIAEHFWDIIREVL